MLDLGRSYDRKSEAMALPSRYIRGKAEQHGGIVGALDSRFDDRLVGVGFALGAQRLRREPNRRVEPKDGALDLGDKLHEAVEATHVSKLVEENGSHLIL